MSYDPNDPTTWSQSAASGFALGLDLGFMQDHSAIVLAGVWPQAEHAIGVVHIEQLPLGTPMEEVADRAVLLAQTRNARIVADLSNNSAFAGLLASRIGRQCANHMIAAVITAADTHAGNPVAMPVSVGGFKAAVPRWSLSKAELIESIAVEMEGGALRLGQTGDREKLRDELEVIERFARRSGSVSYSAPSGKHDDLVIALALAVFGCRRLAGAVRRRGRSPSRMTAAAWT